MARKSKEPDCVVVLSSVVTNDDDVDEDTGTSRNAPDMVRMG